MKYSLELKGFEEENSSEEGKIRKLIEHKISSLSERAKAFRPDEIFLRVLVEQIAGGKMYRLSIAFDLPSKTLAAKEEDSNIESAISAAFSEIERQFDAYRAIRRGEHEWKRIARRKELKRRKATT